MTFYRWFGGQRRRQDPIGDLARDLYLDPNAPRKKSYHLFAYLMRRRPRETREAAREWRTARALLTVRKKPPARETAPAIQERKQCIT
jgi:hypothetical protein